MYVMNVYTGHSETKRLRRPTKRLLESAEEYEQIFIPKKKSKKHIPESSKMVRRLFFSFFTIQVRLLFNIPHKSEILFYLFDSLMFYV